MRNPLAALALAFVFVFAPRIARAQGSSDAGAPLSNPEAPLSNPEAPLSNPEAPPLDAGAPQVDAGAPQVDAGPVIVPSRLLTDSPAPYPPEAAKKKLAGEVQLRVTVDVDGTVSRAELLHGVDPLLDHAALEAAMKLVFTPTTVDGKPVPATLGYVYRFIAPVEAPARAVLSGELRRRGMNSKAAGATVSALSLDDPSLAVVTALTGPDGRFTLDLTPGGWDVVVSGSGLDRFERKEHLWPAQKLEVLYYLTGPRSPFETVVVGERERVEVSRTNLSGPELRQVPGTMGGDPFRAVLTLPGVALAVSGVAFPIIRGASPASTGWYLDGVHLPNLFHFFLLSAVVHPDFVDGISFYPSAYPAEFGRYTGGIVSARTANGRVDRAHGEVSVDIVNSGAFVEAPLHLGQETLSVAAGGRFSYLGVGLKLVNDLGANIPGYADYWDYQARAEMSPSFARGTFRIFFFGSHDEAGVTDGSGAQQRALAITFHRADLRWRGVVGPLEVEGALTLGIDALGTGPDLDVDSRELDPRLTATWKRGPLTLRFGGDGELKHISLSPHAGSSSPDDTEARLFQPVTGGFAGAWIEAQLKLGRWLLVPGLRADLYESRTAQDATLEPRLSIRYALNDATTLKIGGGLYHQSPTAFADLPFVDLLALDEGLQKSANGAVGVERRLDSLGLDLDASFYWSEKLVLREIELDDPDHLGSQTDPLRARRGRSYGIEVMLRRKLGEKLFGWVAYTLSRTTRWTPGLTTYPELFDQTHILNVVASYQLPDRWRIGIGVHANSGKPYTSAHLEELDVISNDGGAQRCGRLAPSSGTTAECWIDDATRGARLPFFFRIDARIEKSFELDRFTLTAYLDVLNASAQSEVLARDYTFDPEGDPLIQDTSVPLIIPMLGLKGSM